MRYLLGTALILGLLASSCWEARAAGCVNGVYHAGCVGPNGAAVVRKPS